MRTHALAVCLLINAFGATQQRQLEQTPIPLGQLAGQSEPSRNLNVRGLGQLVQEIASDDLLRFAQQASAQAKQDEDRGRVLDAALQYEGLLQHIQQDPGNRDTTAIHLMNAAAYMDAARSRFEYAQRTNDRESTERVSRYLKSAQTEISASVSKHLIATVPIVEWSCTVSRLQGQSHYMEALINRNPADLDEATKSYQGVERCEPQRKAQVEELLSQIRSTKRTMTNSIISGDAIVKDIKDVLKLAGWKGDVVSLVVEKVWDYKKTHAKEPDINVR